MLPSKRVLASRLALVLSIGAFSFPAISNAAPLNGDYEVGPNMGSNYGTIAAAVTALMSNGVSGPVNFKVQSGVYTARIDISGLIPGASAVNRGRFGSKRDSAAAVTVQSDASLSDGSDAVVTLTGTKYVSVE